MAVSGNITAINVHHLIFCAGLPPAFCLSTFCPCTLPASGWRWSPPCATLLLHSTPLTTVCLLVPCEDCPRPSPVSIPPSSTWNFGSPAGLATCASAFPAIPATKSPASYALLAESALNALFFLPDALGHFVLLEVVEVVFSIIYCWKPTLHSTGGVGCAEIQRACLCTGWLPQFVLGLNDASTGFYATTGG